MTIINHADKTTLDIDAAKVETLANQAQGMMAVVKQQVAAQMENMSEEEHEKLANMLKTLGGEPESVVGTPDFRSKYLAAASR